MTAQTNRQFLLAKRPVGAATRETFTYQQVPVGEPAAGQILVKNEYLSLDPAMRGWMNEGKSYICLLYTSPSPRDRTRSRMPSSA